VPIIKDMNGMTITEMAEKLGLPRDTVMRRILRGGFEPLTKDAIYAPEVFEAIKNVPGKGRPPKRAPEPDTLPKKGKK
jgi:hypothetical protein